MRKKLLLARSAVLCLLVLLTLPAFSQNKIITGKITDSAGAPVAGVSVTAAGSASGTTTDAAGVFRLSVSPEAKTLVVSSIGYATQRIAITGGEIRVSLAATSNIQNEVVVIGYGGVQKKDLTGAISTISTKDFQKGAITSPDQLIAGKLAGVTVTANGGSPGAGSTIRIRGISSLSSNNAPLIVLDGVPLPSTVKSNGTSDGTSTISGVSNALSLINPDDIESMTVLKDASSAAIYGSRASAGVIIVITKKGHAGDATYNFNTSNSVGTVAKDVSVLSAGQFRNYVNAQAAANPADSTFADKMGNSSTNWQKVIFQNALTTNDNIAVSGSTGNLPYRVSFGYHDESGLVRTDLLQRGTVGIHLTPHFFDNHLKVELNLNGVVAKSRFANGGAIGDAISFDPTQSPYAKSSQFGGYFEWTNAASGGLNSLATRNPLALLEQYNNTGTASNSIGNLHLDYELPMVPGLHAIANFGYDVTNGHGRTIVPADAAQDILNSPGPGLNSKYKANNTYTVEDYSLNYIKDLPSIKSNINVLGLFSYASNLITPYNYASFDTKGDTIAGSAPVYPTSPYKNTLVSYVGRVIYTFDHKYIVTASIREDGSSRFAPNKRWGIFPAVAAAWRVDEEPFLKNVRWLSDFKIRGSYGKTGNQDGLADYEYIPSYSLSINSSQYQLGNSYYNMYTPAPYNPNFQWEETTSSNIGFDFGVMNNRISGSVDYYYKSVVHMFNNIFIPVGSNFTNQLTENIGTMKDQGIEFNLNAKPIVGRHFSWDMNFNFTYNSNKITRLLNNSESPNFYGNEVGGIAGGTGNTIQIQTVGHTANSFWVLQQVYGSNGKPIEGAYVDRNRDGVITTPNDQYHYKSPFAPYIMGFSSTFTYDKWSLSLVARANIGNYMYNNVDAGLGVSQYIMNPLQYLQNATTSYLKTNFYTPQYFSDYYIQNASFLKLDNIGLGYNVGKIGYDATLRLNANCQNVFVITKFTGIDPEAYSGIYNNIYPRARTYTIGASLNF